MEDEESEDWGRWEDEEDMDMVSPVVVGTSLNVHGGSVPVKTVEEGQEKPVHSELGRCARPQPIRACRKASLYRDEWKKS
jgi:hypothetical protein